MATLSDLRRDYHAKIGAEIVRFTDTGGKPYPNFADRGSQSSALIASGIAEAIGFPMRTSPRVSGQTAGSLFEKITCDFIEA